MSVYDASGSQSGDHHIGQVGQTITNQGASPDRVLDFLRSYVFEADQRRETAIKELRDEASRLREDMHIVSDAVRSVRRRVDDIIDEAERDQQARVTRQRALDMWLALITLALVVMAGGWLFLLIRLWPQLTAVALALLGGAP